MKENMKMKNHYIGVDIVRSIALLLVMVYHVYVLNGSVTSTHINFIDKWIELGGEIGVTCFFCISGFGIYWSLKKDGKYTKFIYKRIKRIVPQYYVTIIVLLLIGEYTIFLSKDNLIMVILYFIFGQNIVPSWAGAINGALWTMAVIVQFYIVAPWIYKLIKKFGVIVPGISIIITIFFKYIAFNSFLFQLDAFWTSRQLLLSSIDNFVVGMYISYYIDVKDKKINKKYYIGLILCLCFITGILYLGTKCGIHTINWSGYTWHSLLSIGIAGILLCISLININVDNLIIKGFIWLARYEYGIYLWHLVIIRNLIEKSGLYKQIIQIKHGYWLGDVILIFICILFGYMSTKIIEKGIASK